MDAFQCPPDCGWCCTHLTRTPPAAEKRGTREWRALLRGLGVYHCTDATTTGLSVSSAEARAMRDAAARLGTRLPLHPRTFLLETRRRAAIVLDWHMPRAACPLYADYKCTAYDARPLVCRAYPVMMASPLGLAPECPKVPAPRSALRVELRARRDIESVHAALDSRAMAVLDAPGARFAKGLAAREAAARAARWRVVDLDRWLDADARAS